LKLRIVQIEKQNKNFVGEPEEEGTEQKEQLVREA
jgi:hypothetical protein